MASVDIRQHRRKRVVLRPEQSRIAIVSEAAGELAIESFNELGRRRCWRVNAAVDVRPSDGLKVRHHQSGRNPFSAYIRAKDSNSFLAEIEEIVQIAADGPRRQGSA